MATRDAERRYVGSANIVLTKAMRERLYAKVQEGKGAPPRGADKPDAEWIKPGLVGRVKTLKRENKLRHATLRAIRGQRHDASPTMHISEIDRCEGWPAPVAGLLGR
ncbi:hypothetical protein [Mesorhizobium sp. LMG17149]|uniref:ATP dependent DNA ligase n=1 Tax=Mesorhizobium sp. LMG17149 TaxID=2968497 RepID=UPI0035571286